MACALAGYSLVCNIWLTGSEEDNAWVSAAYLEDELRVAFGDCATKTVWDVMSQDNVVQRERDGRPMRQMRYRHGSRCTSMFMQQDYIRQAPAIARTDQLG